MGNIKNYQQHLLFYYSQNSLNKMLLKIAPIYIYIYKEF